MLSPLFGPFTLPTAHGWCGTTDGLISAGTFDHLLTDLSLKLLRLTAEFIQLVEHCLEFFRRQTGHGSNPCKRRYIAVQIWTCRRLDMGL